MPKLKDSEGNIHHSYASLYKAEYSFKKEAARGDFIVRKAHPGETDIERAKRLHRPRPRSKPEDDSIVITESKPAEKVPAPQVYYCLNCGKSVTKGDKQCQTCGTQLDWSAL